MAIDDVRVPRGDWTGEIQDCGDVAGLVVKILYVRERSLYSIRSLILSQRREARKGVM